MGGCYLEVLPRLEPARRLERVGRPAPPRKGAGPGRPGRPHRAGLPPPRAEDPRLRALFLAEPRAEPPRPRGRRPPPVLMPTHVLGISCFYHDAAAALLKDGEIVAACQEERLS